MHLFLKGGNSGCVFLKSWFFDWGLEVVCVYSQKVKRDFAKQIKLICKDIWGTLDIYPLKVWLVISENLKDERGMC